MAIKTLTNKTFSTYMKYYLSILLLSISVCNISYAVNGQSLLTVEEQNWLKNHPKLKLGVDPSWPPFDFLDQSNIHSGLAADYIQLLSRKLDVSIELQPNLTWEQVLAGAQQRNLDIVSAAQKTPDRSKYLLFTNPMVKVPWVVVSRKDAPVRQGLGELHNNTIAMVKGYAIVELSQKKYPNLKIELVDSPLDGLRAVATGKVTVFVENLGVAGHLIQSHGFTNLDISSDAGLGLQEISIAVRSDWPELVSIFNKELADLSQDEVRQITQRWIPLHGTQYSTIDQQYNDWVWPIVIGICVFGAFLASLYYFQSLRSERMGLQFGTRKFNLYVAGSVCLFIAVIFSTSWFGLRANKQGVLLDTQNTLQTVLDTTTESLYVWLANKKSIVNHVTHNEQLIKMVVRLLDVPVDRQSLLSASVTNDLRKFHRKEKSILGELGFFVINKDNISIGSMRNENVGTINLISLQRPDLLEKVFNGESVFIPPIYSDVALAQSEQPGEANLMPPTMFIASPIKNNRGEVIAAFTVRLDPAKQFSQILRTGHIGKTGETYAIDNRGFLLSKTRFEEHLVSIGLLPQDRSSVLSIRISDPGGNMTTGFRPQIPHGNLPLTTMASSVLNGRGEVNTKGYRDYRGVLVFGAWAWLPELGIGLTTEIDAAEALEAYYTSRRTILIIISIVLLATISTLVFTLTMANRANRILQRSRDELESKVAERTEEIRSKEVHFKDILESSPIGVIMTTLDGSIRYANTGATELIRCEHKQLLTMSANDFYLDPKDRDRLITQLKTKGFVHNAEVKLKRADSTEGWGLMSLIPTTHEDQPAILAWFADITTRIEHERELAEAKKLAEQANHAKSEFLSSMSHELRTPLNAIIGFGQLLELDVEDEQAKENVGEIVKAGHHLLELINDILNLSAIESGKFQLSIEEVSLDDILTECSSLINPLAEKSDIKLRKPSSQRVGYSVLADYIRLKQVLLNLLSNAVKYTREGGSIAINCEALPENKIRIVITDTGMGLSDEQQQQLFQEFNRVGAEKTNIEGTGIGLVITKRLVELMGGVIGVKSQPGKGSSFWIELNRADGNEQSSVGQQDESSEANKTDNIATSARKSILYIEDNPANLRLVTQIIEQHSPHDIISAPDGRLGMVLATSQQPDLILLDINLPDQDGYEILKNLQQNDITRSIPVIAVSANAMARDLAKGHKAGFTDYITKPIVFNKLLDAINNVLG